MGKYQPLARYLKDLTSNRWDARFEEIERILEFELPPSAREHKAWWGNSRRGNHSQAKGWIEAGWEVSHVDKVNEKVTLERSRNTDAGTSDTELVELWKKASDISGITDPKELRKAAALCFIRREAGRQLAAMGGTMPDFKAPPRERPTW